MFILTFLKTWKRDITCKFMSFGLNEMQVKYLVQYVRQCVHNVLSVQKRYLVLPCYFCNNKDFLIIFSTDINKTTLNPI